MDAGYLVFCSKVFQRKRQMIRILATGNESLKVLVDVDGNVDGIVD